MRIVVIFDIVNINSFLIFRSNNITHGGKPPNCNGTANLYLGYNYSLQRYISTSFMNFLEIDFYNQYLAEWNYGNEFGQNKLEE